MYRDTVDTTYTLRDGATPLVQCGERVAAGDVIASGGGPPVVVPYAALLRLSADAAAEAIARQDGGICRIGASLGARRIGLKTHTVSAPASGVTRGLPRSGALVVRDETTMERYRARYPGTVRERSDEAIVITSDVARCVYTFADAPRGISALHIEQALLRAVSAEESVTQLPHAAASTVIAHLSDTDHLTSVLRSFDGTLLVGSVTEPVAWALWERSLLPASRRTKGAGIILLDGVGNAQDGARAVAPFRQFDGAFVTIDRFTQTVTIIPASGPLMESETLPIPDVAHHGERRDPAKYRTPCEARGAPHFAVTDVGARALCVMATGDSAGEQHIPMQNVQRLSAFEG